MPDTIEKKLNILLVDDYPVIDSSIGDYLRGNNYDVKYVQTAEEALKIFLYRNIDIIITDLRLPGEHGFDFIKKIKEIKPDTDIIIITGHGDLDSAIHALRMEVTDFFKKPVDLKQLLLAIKKTQRYQQVLEEKKKLQEELNILKESQDKYGLGHIIGRSKSMLEVKDTIKKVINFPETSVLIEGESGTGKELIARAIHYEGANSNKPFVPVNSSSIPETLIESELFGHEKGSFTDAKTTRKGLFEQANGGTIFLDEIGDISLSVQKNLLRVLENREVRYVGGNRIIKLNLRVVAATNRNLEKMVTENTFRQDLFYRLNIFRIYIPPLRERKDDIEILANHFLREFNVRLRKGIKGIRKEAIEELKLYNYPGNIRELRNIMEQAIILCAENYLLPKHFPILFRKDKFEDKEEYNDLNLEKMEKRLIIEALKRTNYNKSNACKMLGITRDSLRRKLDKYSIIVARTLQREEV